MAVQKTDPRKNLRLILDNGTTEKGTPRTKSVSYSSIKADAADDALYEVAQGLGSLQAKALKGVEVVETFRLGE